MLISLYTVAPRHNSIRYNPLFAKLVKNWSNHGQPADWSGTHETELRCIKPYTCNTGVYFNWTRAQLSHTVQGVGKKNRRFGMSIISLLDMFIKNWLHGEYWIVHKFFCEFSQQPCAINSKVTGHPQICHGFVLFGPNLRAKNTYCAITTNFTTILLSEHLLARL